MSILKALESSWSCSFLPHLSDLSPNPIDSISGMSSHIYLLSILVVLGPSVFIFCLSWSLEQSPHSVLCLPAGAIPLKTNPSTTHPFLPNHKAWNLPMSPAFSLHYSLLWPRAPTELDSLLLCPDSEPWPKNLSFLSLLGEKLLLILQATMQMIFLRKLPHSLLLLATTLVQIFHHCPCLSVM